MLQSPSGEPSAVRTQVRVSSVPSSRLATARSCSIGTGQRLTARVRQRLGPDLGLLGLPDGAAVRERAALHRVRPFVVPETSEALLDWVAGLMLQCSIKALVECNRALTGTDFRPELAQLAAQSNVPILIVHGDKDV